MADKKFMIWFSFLRVRYILLGNCGCVDSWIHYGTKTQWKWVAIEMWFFVLLESCIQFAFIEGSEIKNPPSCFRSCPNAWEEVDNACFLWPDVTKSWANAEKYCNDENSHLASVSNQETHDYIRSRVRTTDSTAFFWLGGSDKDQEGH